MKIINQDVLDQLSREAAESPRLRKNLNMHDEYSDPCQRLFNAMQPGTYIRPHRHLDPFKAECFMAVRGKMALVVFDDEGVVEKVVPFGNGCDVTAIELPPGQWHTLLVLESGSIFFETKPGPYVPLSDKDFGPWSPPENSPEVTRYLADLIRIAADYC
jgi:cupin fold WbuC family metalloprotein